MRLRGRTLRVCEHKGSRKHSQFEKQSLVLPYGRAERRGAQDELKEGGRGWVVEAFTSQAGKFLFILKARESALHV